ncbi:MAG: glycosyltransferase [Gammaproteobacteria bacterium]|jgi:glycosyltransferase involved in cell wall biosynthesis
MRVLHVCVSDAQGGAAIGAYQLHRAMLEYGVDSRMMVLKKLTDDDTVVQPLSPAMVKLIELKKKLTILSLQILQPTKDPALRSINIFPSGLGKKINAEEVDIVQLHWICNGTLGIGEIAALNKPVVWKQPDMWGFSGAEHYILPTDNPRFKDGYTKNNREKAGIRIDVNRWLWMYKRRKWRNKTMTIVTPSPWLARCAKESVLFKNYNVHQIFNPIDLGIFRPYSQLEVRDLFKLPHDKKIIMFGALSSIYNTRKGYQYLHQALEKFVTQFDVSNIEIVIFGADKINNVPPGGLKIHCLGTIHDHQLLAKLYSVADVIVIPSLQDNLPNVMKEAMSCGIPCVSFAVGGMVDMVEHKITGYLAKPYDVNDLSNGIIWVLNNSCEELSTEVRRQAEIKYDPTSRVREYLNLYKSILHKHKPEKNSNCCL